MKEKRIGKALLVLLIAGILGTPNVDSHAAVITSNATDKIAVVFDENTAYNAGDYILYDGELYICVSDIQGTWDTVQEHFLQVTKNHELGQDDELSAEYQSQRDPSEEKSLMSFVANAWQKLKEFFGINHKTAETDKESYTEATVSAKLNYLKTQNEGLETQNHVLEGQNNELTDKFNKLQDKVDKSFISVSNGKSILADAITDKGVTVSSSATFEQFKSSVLALCEKKKEEGRQAGLTEADGRVNKNSQSYKAGMDDADKRENTGSASYKKGLADGKEESKLKEYRSDISLACGGPGGSLKDGEAFTYYYENDYLVHWNYTKTFSGQQKIRYAYVADSKQEGGISVSSTKAALLVDDTYVFFKNGNDAALGKMSIENNTVKLNDYLFNPTYGGSANIHIRVFYE